MATSEFDPTKYGATKFDPAQYGATKFDPNKTGATAVANKPQPIQSAQPSLADRIKGVLNYNPIEHAAPGIVNFFGGKNLAEVGGSLLTGQSLPQALRTQGGGSMLKGVGRVAGDVGQIGATIASLELPGATSIAGKAAQFGGLAAAGAGAKSISEGQGPLDIAKNAFVAGLTGAAIGGTIGVVEKGVSALTRKAPEAMYNNVLKIDQKIRQAGKSPSQFLLDNNTWGNLGTISSAAENGIDDANAIIAEKLSLVPPEQATLSSKDIITKATERLKAQFGYLYSQKQIQGVMESLPINELLTKDTIDIKTANIIRQQLDKTLGPRHYLNPTAHPISKEATEAVANTLRDIVQKTSNTSKEFAELTKWIITRNATTKAMQAADSKFGLGLMDAVAGSAGAIAGGVPGAVAGVAAEKSLRSAAVQTGTAQLLDKVGKLPTDTLGRVSKTAVINFIKAITNPGQK